ncbi:MAG: hypothetical protein ACLPUT_02710 [Solirubrobacteraceae bacterium]|jgi:hypothetical protein
MRPSLLHPLGEPRHSRRHRRGRGARAVEAVREPPARTPDPVEAPPTRACDPAVQRAREAGGPIDHASYTCSCGYLFCASVSTTVTCPHCGADQAW